MRKYSLQDDSLQGMDVNVDKDMNVVCKNMRYKIVKPR